MRYLITFATLLLVLPFQQKPTPTTQAQKTGKTSQQSKEEIKTFPSVPYSINSYATYGEPSKIDKGDQQTKGEDSEKSFVHWMAYLNVISTIVVAVFTVLIFFVYRAMLRASKINERAWIVPVIGVIEPTPDLQKFQVSVALKNNGKTPAWITASGSRGKGATKQQPLPAKPPYSEMGPFHGKGSLLAPTGAFDHGFSLEKQMLDSVQNGLSQVFIFGYAKYRDVYGDSHIVRYCFEAQRAQDANHPHPLEFYVGGPHEYMEAD